mgnify:CR=1 FL=1
MINNKKPKQKLVSFSDQSPEMESVLADMREGWFFSSITCNGKNFVGIMEKRREDVPEDHVYIPARKKIRFLS